MSNVKNFISSRINSLMNRSILHGARPLFLIGAPRSGTTILANLLNAHSQILLTHETSVFLQLDEIITKSPLGRRAGDLFGELYNDLWAKHIHSNSKLLIESFYCKIAAEQNRERLCYWGEKHPHFERCLQWVNSMYPDAVYIYAFRDPRDTVCSIARMNKTSISNSLREWSRIVNKFETFLKILPQDYRISIKYEDLVDNYELVISNVLNFLGLQMDESSEKYLQTHKNVSAHRPGSNIQVMFSESSVGRWQNEMSIDELVHVERVCGQFMNKYGYTAEGS